MFVLHYYIEVFAKPSPVIGKNRARSSEVQRSIDQSSLHRGIAIPAAAVAEHVGWKAREMLQDRQRDSWGERGRLTAGVHTTGK